MIEKCQSLLLAGAGESDAAARDTDMALCSFNIQKSTLLLFWKMLNSSKACCFLRHRVCVCVGFLLIFIFLWFPQCRKAVRLNVFHLEFFQLCQKLSVQPPFENACWMWKRVSYISVYKRNPSVGHTGRKVSKCDLWIHFMCFCPCLCTYGMCRFAFIPVCVLVCAHVSHCFR